MKVAKSQLDITLCQVMPLVLGLGYISLTKLLTKRVTWKSILFHFLNLPILCHFPREIHPSPLAL